MHSDSVSDEGSELGDENTLVEYPSSSDMCPIDAQTNNSSSSKKTVRKNQKVLRKTEVVENILSPAFCILPLTDPSTIDTQRVQFPELGMDLVQGIFSYFYCTTVTSTYT